MNRIKELRELNNITQQELGRIINVNGSAISKYESERIPLTASTIQALADYFNVSTDYLLCKSNDSQPISGQNTFSSNNNELENLFNDYKKNGGSNSFYKKLYSLIPEIQPTVKLSQQEEKLLITFKELNEDNRDIIIGKAKELLREQRISSNKPSQDTTTNEYPTTYAEFQKIYPTASPSNYQKEKNDVG